MRVPDNLEPMDLPSLPWKGCRIATTSKIMERRQLTTQILAKPNEKPTPLYINASDAFLA